jgi:hypothetical protein
MKSALLFMALLSLHLIHPLNQPNPTEEEREEQREVTAIFKRAQQAQYTIEGSTNLKTHLRRYPNTVNLKFTSVPFFMDLAYRQFWKAFKILLNEHEKHIPYYSIDTTLKDKDHNNLIHILVQTGAPLEILAQTCSLFPHLVNELNNEERQDCKIVTDKDGKQKRLITKTHRILTPLEFLLITKKDKGETARTLLLHGAKITEIAKWQIAIEKHPKIEALFKKPPERLVQIESLPLPLPYPQPDSQPFFLAPTPLGQRPTNPHPLRRGGTRINLFLSSSGNVASSSDDEIVL